MRIFRLVLFVLLLLPTPRVAGFDPGGGFSDGETFIYRVSWGFFSDAGLAIITADRSERKRRDLLRLVLDMEAHGLVGRFYPLDKRSLAMLENDTGRIIWHREIGYDGRNGVDNETAFDYTTRRAFFVDRLRPERNRIVDFPDGGNPTDLIFALIQTRHWRLNPGEERQALVYASRDIYPVVIRAEGFEPVETPSGDYDALLLVPRMREDTEPKGIFDKGGEIRVWIAGEAAPLPIKMQLRQGSRVITLTLISHYPGQSQVNSEGARRSELDDFTIGSAIP